MVLLWEAVVAERGSCLCSVAGELENGGDEKVTYTGDSRKCIMLK